MYARSHHNQKRSGGAGAGRWLVTAMAALALAACDETPVSLPTASTVAVGAETITLHAGDGTEIGAQVLDQDDQAMEGMFPTWSSSDPSVAAIFETNEGRATVVGVTPGETTLTASYGSASAEVAVTVVNDDLDDVASFTFDVETAEAHINDGALQIPYSAYDREGDDVCASSGKLVVESSDESIVDFTGANCDVITVNLNGTGTATVTATIDGQSGSVEVTVTDEMYNVFWATPNYDPMVGETNTFSVKVVDEETGAPVEGHRVNFEVVAGSLDETSAETDENGIASVDWTYPTMLNDIGTAIRIDYHTRLPDGSMMTEFLTSSVDLGEPDELRWYLQDDLGNWSEITGGSLELDIDEEYRIIANLYDEYGNIIDLSGTSSDVTSDDGGIVNASGSQNFEGGDALDSNSPYIDVESGTETTATLTADLEDSDGNEMDDELDIEFVDNS